MNNEVEATKVVNEWESVTYGQLLNPAWVAAFLKLVNTVGLPINQKIQVKKFFKTVQAEEPDIIAEKNEILSNGDQKQFQDLCKIKIYTNFSTKIQVPSSQTGNFSPLDEVVLDNIVEFPVE